MTLKWNSNANELSTWTGRFRCVWFRVKPIPMKKGKDKIRAVIVENVGEEKWTPFGNQTANRKTLPWLFFSSCGNRISTLIWNPPKFTAVHSLWCAFGMVYSVCCHVTTGGYDGLMDPTNADQFLKVLLCPIRSTSSINWSTNDSMLVWNYSKQKWN